MLREEKTLLRRVIEEDADYKKYIKDIISAKSIYDINIPIQLIMDDFEKDIDKEKTVLTALNMRSILLELPSLPITMALPIEDLASISDFDYLGHDTYLKEYKSSNDIIYSLEMIAQGNACNDLRFHREFDIFSIEPSKDKLNDYNYSDKFIDLFLINDDGHLHIKGLIEDMGLAFQPKMYRTVENYFYETIQDYLGGALGKLF